MKHTETEYDFLDPLDRPAKLLGAKEHGSAQLVLNTANLGKIDSKYKI
jgi:hypothetical protein